VIVGIGSDLCEIERVERPLARYGERFTARCFTEIEQRRSDERAARAASYAKRFAAKEACAKALGTGLKRGVFWRDMGVVNLPSGQPTMRLTGGAAERLKAIAAHGLASMRHRVAALGGVWHLSSPPSGGTTVTAVIPLARMLAGPLRSEIAV